MNFQVPQFIEIEDKIFGPLSLKQFLYVVGGAGLAFLFYTYLPIYLAIFPMVGVASLAGLLAFYRYNDRPFIDLLESAFMFVWANKLYIWKKAPSKNPPPKTVAPSNQTSVQKEPEIKTSRLSASRLKDLAWSLDVKDVIR